MMKNILFIVLLVYSSVTLADSSRLYHRLEPNRSIASIFQRLNLYPLFGETGYVTKTLELNPLIQKMGQVNLPPNFLLRLPPLPIKKSKDWIVQGDLLIFTDNTSQKIKNHAQKSPWIFKGSLHSILEDISLRDKRHRMGTIKTDKSWGIGTEVIYQQPYRSFHLSFHYNDFTYSDGATINWTDSSAKKVSYQLSMAEKLTQKYSLNLGIGKSDLLSFQSVAPSTLKIIRKNRLYAKVGLSYDFSFFIPIRSSLNFSVFESLNIENIKFKVGYEALLRLSTKTKLKSGSELIFFAQAGHKDEAPKDFKQTSKFISLGFGFRWGGK